jgi:cell division transport system permease protein
MTQVKKKKTGKFNTITSCISTSLVLILLGTATFCIKLSENFGRELRENFTVEVLLDYAIRKEERETMHQELTALPYVKQVSYISKEEGMKEMAAVLEGGPQEFLGFNTIPAEFELFLNAAYANQDSLLYYIPDLYNYKKVTDVIYPKDAMEFVDHVIPLIGTLLIFVASLLGFISFALIHNTMRMSIYARRFSIHTMKLVGARWGFIRRPFMLRAFWIGFWAAIVANALVGIGMYWLYSLDAYIGNLVTQDVVWTTFGINFACGLCLTIISAYISVNKFLKMTTSQLFMN